MSAISVSSQTITSVKSSKKFVEVILHTINEKTSHILTQFNDFKRFEQQRSFVNSESGKIAGEVKEIEKNKKDVKRKKNSNIGNKKKRML